VTPGDRAAEVVFLPSRKFVLAAVLLVLVAAAAVAAAIAGLVSDMFELWRAER
jgi:hypothetical protein